MSFPRFALPRHGFCIVATMLLAACTTAPHGDTRSGVTAASAPPAAASTRLALAPGEHRIKASDGSELYLKIAGQGPVCLLVHGGPGQGSLSTEKMGADKLERFLTMVYLDQRGSGKSPDATDYHLDRVLQDFDDVRKALGVDRMCLIAHSFGGILAVNYATRYPQHVSRMVMANTTLHIFGIEQARMQIAFANRLLGREAVKPLADDADFTTIRTSMDAARKALVDGGLGYRFLAENRDGIRVMSEIDGSYTRSMGYGMSVVTRPGDFPEYLVDYAPATAAIRVPVLVITGSKDYAVGPDEYKRFRFPQQTTVVLDSGHMSYFEKTDGFIAAIRDFMGDAQR